MSVLGAMSSAAPPKLEPQGRADGVANFAPFRLDTARIDVALIPNWVVTDDEGRRVIERWIRPRQVVAFHVGSDDADRAARDVRSAMPNAVTLVRSLETHRW